MVEVFLGDDVVVAAEFFQPVDDEQVDVEVPVPAGGAHVLHRPMPAGIGDAPAVGVAVVEGQAHFGMLDQERVDVVDQRQPTLIDLGCE